jgi:alpha-tubulin suppressor-like RCC1 family protein
MPPSPSTSPCPTHHPSRAAALPLLLSGILLLGGCQEAPTGLTAPEFPSEDRIQAETMGTPNPFVHFLPPILPSSLHEGVFVPDLEPEVVIHAGTATPCEGAETQGCASEVARFTTSQQGASAIRMNGREEHYVVNWQVDRGTDPEAVHRISVRLDGALLDYVFVSGLRGTLPIRFRIEEGATGVGVLPIDEAGGTVATPTGSAQVDIPEGALESEEAISVASVALDPAVDEGVVEGTKHFFGPSGTTFAEPVTLTLRYDPSLLPDGVAPGLLRLHRFENDGWTPIPGSRVDPVTGTVSGEVSGFSLYALLPLTFQTLSSGGSHACALTDEGAAWCWGSNDRGQLGSATGESCDGAPCSTHGVEVPGGPFTALAAGWKHTCALDGQGTAWCWGSNERGELGTGADGDSPIPVTVATDATIASLDSGWWQTCGVTQEGQVLCWGMNSQGQLGIPGSASPDSCTGGGCSRLPVLVEGLPSVASVSSGLAHTCALTGAGVAWCWGWNAFSQLTDELPEGAGNVPPSPLSTGPWASISAGAVHSCAVTGTGSAFCWGGVRVPPFGALGNGELAVEGSGTPVPVAGGLALDRVAMSPGNNLQTFACAVSNTGAPYCWGANALGQLGVASGGEICAEGQPIEADCASAPVAVSGGLFLRTIAPNMNFTCGITFDGGPTCWGDNRLGQLGDGTQLGRSTPAPVRFTP